MIKKSVVLRCSPERAFVLFTEHAGAWWPAERRHTRDASSEIRLEAVGRFFERASDGTEVELGVVRAFEPASRLMLDWYPGTGPDNPTQVEVTFEAIDTGTRVTIVHGPGSAGDEVFGRHAAVYAQSWDLILTALPAQELTQLNL
jgi:uncharacterized protein YndB with AHSA1/START domain